MFSLRLHSRGWNDPFLVVQIDLFPACGDDLIFSACSLQHQKHCDAGFLLDSTCIQRAEEVAEPLGWKCKVMHLISRLKQSAWRRWVRRDKTGVDCVLENGIQVRSEVAGGLRRSFLHTDQQFR